MNKKIKKISCCCGESLADYKCSKERPAGADDLLDHFFEFSHFMNGCLKFKHKAKADMPSYKEVYKGMQKKVKGSKVTIFSQEYGHHSSE